MTYTLLESCGQKVIGFHQSQDINAVLLVLQHGTGKGIR